MAVKMPLRIERKERLLKELDRIIPLFKKLGASKVILFGSLVSGDIGTKSDIDLVVIKDTNERFFDRLNEFYKCYTPSVAVDILCYTPQEFKDMAEMNNSFMRNVIKKGKVLYEE